MEGNGNKKLCHELLDPIQQSGHSSNDTGTISIIPLQLFDFA